MRRLGWRRDRSMGERVQDQLLNQSRRRRLPRFRDPF
jgi:hypothetical protein